MIESVQFHGEQTDVFEFLNYKGFANIHRKRSIKEYKCFREFRDFLISYTGKIQKIQMDRSNTIPEIFYGETKENVTPQERKKYTKESFDRYIAWEESVLKEYSSAYKDLISENEVVIAEFLLDIIKETFEEYTNAKKIRIELENTEYGAHHLERIQPDFM